MEKPFGASRKGGNAEAFLYGLQDAMETEGASIHLRFALRHADFVQKDRGSFPNPFERFSDCLLDIFGRVGFGDGLEDRFAVWR